MVRFISIASGSSGNCYYLDTPEGALLIDMGVSLRTVKKALRQNNLDIDRLKAVLVTHEHTDHIKGLGALLRECFVPVFSSELTFRAIYASRAHRLSIEGAKLYSLFPHHSFSVAGFEITPFFVPHDCAGNMGYHLRRGAFSFTLITDAGSVTEDMFQYAQLSKYLVLEANYDPIMLQEGRYPDHLKARVAGVKGHLSNGDAAKLLSCVYHPEMQNVWLCHLSKDNNTPDICMETFIETLNEDQVHLQDGFALKVLERMTPSSLYAFPD